MLVRRDRMLQQIELLYDERLDYFVQVARAITGDRERAREAVQDAFASVIRARRDFRGDGPLEAFVWRAVVNAARKATRRPLVEVHELASTEFSSPDEAARLAPLIASLPERQRLVVFLRYYVDLDYGTIGTILGIEASTVGPTLAAAHAALRKLLSREVHQ
jgi:RNA polymerase sigma-70 factor (ECF subfamily)